MAVNPPGGDAGSAPDATGPRPDLDSREQIERLVRRFYAQVREDEILAPVFVEQAQVDWNEVIPKITAFWCQLELGVIGFRGNPTRKHEELHAEQPFRSEQFERWVALFHATVDSAWAGPHADSIKARAVMIGQAQSRMLGLRPGPDFTSP